MNREAWFERTFDFTLPVTRFPNLLERLRGTPARLEERTRGIAPDVLTRRPGDRWSIQEHTGHLFDLEPLWLSRAQQIFAGETGLAAADLTNRRTYETNYNAGELAAILRDFRAARTGLVELLTGADDEIIARSALHPRLGIRMRLIDVVFFVAEHDDHHLAAIAGILA